MNVPAVISSVVDNIPVLWCGWAVLTGIKSMLGVGLPHSEDAAVLGSESKELAYELIHDVGCKT